MLCNKTESLWFCQTQAIENRNLTYRKFCFYCLFHIPSCVETQFLARWNVVISVNWCIIPCSYCLYTFVTLFPWSLLHGLPLLVKYDVVIGFIIRIAKAYLESHTDDIQWRTSMNYVWRNSSRYRMAQIYLSFFPVVTL